MLCASSIPGLVLKLGVNNWSGLSVHYTGKKYSESVTKVFICIRYENSRAYDDYKKSVEKGYDVHARKARDYLKAAIEVSDAYLIDIHSIFVLRIVEIF